MHTKPNISFLAFALMAAGLFAFRKPDNGFRNRSFQTALLSGTPDKLDTGGRAVNLDSAQKCINRFEAVMKQHGFSDVAGEKVNIHIKRTSLITTGEVFGGKGLLDWLTQTEAQYTAAHRTLMIKIQLGIYDNDYLNTYQTDPALKTRNLDRIAIFLIPYDSAQLPAPGIHALVAPPPPPPGGTGYDLGGIQP